MEYQLVDRRPEHISTPLVAFHQMHPASLMLVLVGIINVVKARLGDLMFIINASSMTVFVNLSF